MKKLFIILGGLLVAITSFGQTNSLEKQSCSCPSCLAKASGETVLFTLPALQELNAGLENGMEQESQSNEHAQDEHVDCDHGHEAEVVPHDEHEGHAHTEHAHDEDADHDHDTHEVHDEHVDCDHGHDVEEFSHDEHEGHAHDAHAGHDHSGHAAEESGLNISQEMAAKIGVMVDDAKGGTISNFAVFPAEILLNRDRSSAVSPRFSSVVRELFVEIGDVVSRGDVLASLENRATMAVYTVVAPLDGVVVSKDTSVGEAAGEDKVLFEVVDLSTVWADISVFPRFQHIIHKDMPVEFIAHDGHVAHSRVKYISPLVSRETRTFTARCILKGAASDFAPGAFVRAKITTDSTNVRVCVERDAVQVVDGVRMVFVPNEHGFESRDVRVGVSDDRLVEITDGLEAGELYVAEGAFSLKAEMVTSGMDPHAGHGH